MSTRSSIKYNVPDEGPGYHLFDDLMDSFGSEEGDTEPPVYLELFGVQAEVSTRGYVHVAIPRAMARELGLLPVASSPAPEQQGSGIDGVREGGNG